MDPDALGAWLELSAKFGAGVVFVLALFIWALYKGTLVWGKDCDRERAEKNEWKRAALDGTGVLEKIVEPMEGLARRVNEIEKRRS